MKRIEFHFPVYFNGSKITGLGWDETDMSENVMVLSKLKEAKHIDIHVDMSELDVTSAEAENGATYEEIKAYV